MDSDDLVFSEMLMVLKQQPKDDGTGIRKFARRGWNGKGMFISLQYPDANSKMTLPYIYFSTVEGKLVPWLASQTDLLSEDWYEVA